MRINQAVITVVLFQTCTLSTSAFLSPSITHSKSTTNLHVSSFFSPPKSASPPASVKQDPTFTPPNPSGDFSISDPDCIAAASQMKRILVPVPTSINLNGEVGISYTKWASPTRSSLPPILLIPGFDSSCLEYRRLGPALSKLGVDVYAVDLLGWGFTQFPTSSDLDYSATAKVKALQSFWKTLTNDQDVVIAGASLGGAAAIEFAVQPDTPVTACVLLDAQGFVDGVGPVVSMLPGPIAKLGIGVLKSEPLRNSANQMSYFDKETYATEDALKIGRIHCLNEGWDDGMLNFMTTGGFRPKEKVKDITQRTCVLWGRQDGILDGKEFTAKFMETLPNDENELHWVEECGHVPHLEQADVTADIIYNFMKKDVKETNSSEANGWEAVLNIFKK